MLALSLTERAARERAALPLKVASIFGTRPEAVKFGPVLWHLERQSRRFRCVNVNSSQHIQLIEPFLRLFGIRVDYDLAVMRPGQSLNALISRIVSAVDPVFRAVKPDVVLVQGDTTTAMAAALAAFQNGIPVGHIEAGLRTHDPLSPFPEEMNRRLISTLARYHFAPTERNRAALIASGVPSASVVVTGNPIVDAVTWVMRSAAPSPSIVDLTTKSRNRRLIVMTTHRRENFGDRMRGFLTVMRSFVSDHDNVVLVVPVHANPAVQRTVNELLGGTDRVWLVPPLQYADFLHLMAASWLMVSDSGGVQEEVPTLGKPLLILRDTTERPEAIECGMARLVGQSPDDLKYHLAEAFEPGSWVERVSSMANPFGRPNSALRIVRALSTFVRRDGLACEHGAAHG